MRHASFRTKEQADDYASCFDLTKVKYVEVEQDSDGRWVVMYEPK